VKEHTIIVIYLSVHTRNESTRNKIATRMIPPWEMKMQQNMVFLANGRLGDLLLSVPQFMAK